MKTIVSVLLSAIASFLLIGQAYTRTIVTDGLVSYWTFDKKDMTDTTVMDVWGNNNGTIVGTPKSVAGRVGQALEFDGANDYVNLTNLGDFGEKVGSSTFEAWVKTEFKEDWTSLFKVLDVGCNMAWAIDVNRSAQAGFLYAQDVVHFYVRQKSVAGCNHIAAQIDFPLSDGEWHHIVFAVEDAGIPKVNIYMDGTEQIVILGDASKLTTFEPFVEPVYIGAANNRGAVERFFPGVIDEVRIYDRPLSTNEVTRNYESRIGLNVDPIKKLTISWGKIKTDF
ncbi:LamG domain-containing protein [Candidatus Poribacteria bacterium]|nr:LamG domain-containing protein [Candidatus Poribacteria bacterium]MYF54517.1 LamG domain-containing protein [Candidatus Poribacteria bacterium]MYI94482.1 LamG domain-containing protein [Candidatus Poribacteria bacterium]